MVGAVVTGMAVDGEDGMVAAGAAVGMEGTDTPGVGMARPGSGFMVCRFTGVIRSFIRHPHNRSSTNLLRQSIRPRRHVGIMWFITPCCIALANAAAVA